MNVGSLGPAKSSTRESTAPSMSGMSPAMGSMASHASRLGAKAALAAGMSPARTASVNVVVVLTISSVRWATYFL